MSADRFPADPLVAANEWPTICISTPHPDGGSTTRIWCIAPSFAEELSRGLGEPHMTQLIAAEQVEEAMQLAHRIPTLIEEETRG